MRVVGKFSDEGQVSDIIISLKQIGLDRKDMIVSQIENKEEFDDQDNQTFVKSEREDLGEAGEFSEGISGLSDKEGIVVAVEVPKKDRHRVRELMEQTGAREITED